MNVVKHRRTEPFGQRDHLGPGRPGAVPDDDHRTLRRAQGGGGRVQGRVVRTDPPAADPAGRRRSDDVTRLHLHLVGEDQVRHSTPVHRVLDGEGGQLRGVATGGDGRVPDRHVAEHRLEVDVLEGAAAEHARRDLPRQGQHGRAVELGVVQAGEQVRRARTGDGEARGRAAGELPVGTGRERRGALVADADVPQLATLLGPAHRVGEAEVGVADHAEHGVDTVGHQGLDDRVADGPATRLVGRQPDVHAVLALLDAVRRHRVREAFRWPSGPGVVVVAVPRAAQPAVLDRALADGPALVRAPVLQRSDPSAAASQGDRAAVDDRGRDAPFRRHVLGLDPMPLVRHDLVTLIGSLPRRVARDCSWSVSATSPGVTS